MKRIKEKILRPILSAIGLLLCLPVAAADLGKIPPFSVAYMVYDLDEGRIVSQHNADKPMNPASTMKLVTSYVALDVLGEGFRWQTQWTSRAPLVPGVLDGNLFWRGSGDPVFDINALTDMQMQLRGRGVQHVAGSLIMDRSVWNNLGSAEHFASDAGKWFTLAPDPHHISNHVVWQSSCDDEAAPCAMPTAVIRAYTTRNAAYRFVEQWRFLGGSGVTRVMDGRAPSDARVLATHYSPPLSEVIRRMNKFSDNFIARSVFLTLGTSFEPVDTVARAQSVVHDSLLGRGIDDRDLVLENGSGLSRVERLTARMMTQMLVDAYRRPFARTFIDSLPIAGIDGTLKRRFKGMPELRLKTGTLKDVRAYAGYYLPRLSGEHPLTLVVIVNHGGIGNYMNDIDTLTKSLISVPDSVQTVYHREFDRAPG